MVWNTVRVDVVVNGLLTFSEEDTLGASFCMSMSGLGNTEPAPSIDGPTTVFLAVISEPAPPIGGPTTDVAAPVSVTVADEYDSQVSAQRQEAGQE